MTENPPATTADGEESLYKIRTDVGGARRQLLRRQNVRVRGIVDVAAGNQIVADAKHAQLPPLTQKVWPNQTRKEEKYEKIVHHIASG